MATGSGSSLPTRSPRPSYSDGSTSADRFALLDLEAPVLEQFETVLHDLQALRQGVRASTHGYPPALVPGQHLVQPPAQGMDADDRPVQRHERLVNQSNGLRRYLCPAAPAFDEPPRWPFQLNVVEP